MAAFRCWVEKRLVRVDLHFSGADFSSSLAASQLTVAQQRVISADMRKGGIIAAMPAARRRAAPTTN